MVNLDETTLRAFAAKSGLPIQFIFKEAKLFEVLSKVLDANQKAGLDIVLKGGTALNKIYLPGTQRFSEDIDFDLFSKKEELEKIIFIQGFEVQGPWKIKNTLRYHYIYTFFDQKDNVRVEFSINKLRKTLFSPATESMSSEFIGTALYGVPAYSLDDLVARKMNALRSRAEGKDVWDCYHAIPKTKHLKKAIALALESEKLDLSVDDSLQQIISKLKIVDSNSLMKLTNPYIPTSLRPKDWKETIDDLLHQIETLLESK